MRARGALIVAGIVLLLLPVASCRQGRPDLVPFSSKVMFCDADGEGNLLVFVKNIGTATSPNVHVQVVFFLSGGNHVERPALGTGALAPGQTSLGIPVAVPAGCYNPDCDFRITVDFLNESPESNETNNTVDGGCIG